MTIKVAVVGAGLIGRAWAITFARGGATVSLYDPPEGAAAAALGFVDGVLSGITAFGTDAGSQKTSHIGHIGSVYVRMPARGSGG